MSLVLVVDDHVDTACALVNVIRKLGPSAECVFSGDAALAFAATRRPDLIILDVCMPKMDGIETLTHLRATAAGRAVPVAIYTALTDRATHEAARSAGAAAIWDKSAFNLREFAERLRPFVQIDWKPRPNA
jgi:CheY-like chemotaxis protein